jgi:hypothetical protein
MSDLIYHGLFIVSQVFQIVLCIDALYQRNTGMCLGHSHVWLSLFPSPPLVNIYTSHI